MDPSRQSQQLHQQQQQQQRQQQVNSTTPQDALVKARHNLQTLIESGLSKDLLHQWVDESLAPSASLPASMSTPISLSLPPARKHSSFPSQHPPLQAPPAPTMAYSLPVPFASVISTTGTIASPTPDSGSAPLAGSTAVPSPADSIRADVSSSNLMRAAPTPSLSSGLSSSTSLWSINSTRSSMSWASAAKREAAAERETTYWCTSCETKFKRKYDWKRHEDEFHERWRKYPCPEPGCNRSFWGSNSFNQHHRQCHSCKTCPHADKVVKFLRKRKYWACGFCSALHPARERHVEHVARHFESGLGKADWKHSYVIYGLLHQPLVHSAWNAIVIGKEAEYGEHRPRFCWDPSNTGRAQGFLEKENPGQLQDLLEFFSGNEDEAQKVAHVAYDLAEMSFFRRETFDGGAAGEQTIRTPQHQPPTGASSPPWGPTPYFHNPSITSHSLLEESTEPNAKDNQGGWTLLSRSAEEGPEATVEVHLAIEGIDGTPQETRPEPAVPPTDSGYASWHGMQSESGGLKKRGDGESVQPPQAPAEQDVDDARTEYSNASSMSLSRQKSYIWELASDLFSKISMSNANETLVRRISAILPELLKAFALKVGHDAPTQKHRDVMAFVHKHRCEIATAFADISLKQNEEDSERSAAKSDGMPLEELIGLWFNKESNEEVPHEEELGHLDLYNISLEDEEDEEEPESWLLSYREFIFGTEAYEWLLTRLRREFRLVPTEPGTIQTIRDKVLSSLPTIHKISKKTFLQSCSARFELDWDILGFFETQGYPDKPDQVFESVITLTGLYHDAQAATCSQYIHQTWPSTGEAIVRLVKEVLRGGQRHVHSCKISDGTTLTAWTSRTKFIVEANGVAVSLAETAEQLAWLGAALRTSPRQSGLVYCTPIITNIRKASIQSQLSSTDIICEIGFIMEEIPKPPSNANGQCWHGIFRNPVVVRGYPIPQRVEKETGLEISLHIMAGLARTQQVNQFKDKVYIKGFSTMLVPVKQTDSILYWHLIYKQDGSRISYLDDYINEKPHLNSVDIENLRHILGWCSEAKFYAGSGHAGHPDTYSRLPKPHEGCALAGARVSTGRMITGSPAFSIGNKDTPPHVSRNGYIPRLEWISTKFVLLWDEDDKRGWLINGTSALLHVLRASLEYSSKGKFQSALLCKSEDLEESPTPFTADSAVDVLINPNNRNLRLYREGDGYLLLESLIERFYNILEKFIDHQIDIAGEYRNLSDKPRRYLEGWDFEDLAKKKDPLYPCVATLSAAGKGWVDFTRAIHAVTLIGRGFGDIIKPAGANFCDYWAELPKQQYYIASCLSDLAEVMREHGCRGNGSHLRLSDDLIWHIPTTLFASCQCKGALGEDHCEPVQTFFPLPLSARLLPKKHPIQKVNGAVIFGQNSCFSWVWGDTGNPREGKFDEEASVSDAVKMDTTSPKDSGIGPSLAWSGSESQPSSSRSRSRDGRLIPVSGESHSHTMTQEPPPFVKQKKYDRGQYKVGIICALPKELMAVRALFDDDHENPPALPFDINQYSLGVMEKHWIVAACLPNGEYGTNSAAVVAANMRRSFKSIRFCLLVGIAGGVPSEDHDIRLGDVVVSKPIGNCSGVIQYDLGKEKEGRPFERTGSLRPPPRVLNTAVSSLCSDPALPSDPLAPYLGAIHARLKEFPKYSRPKTPDLLLQTACAACEARQPSQEQCSHVRRRVPRQTAAPVIHYGLIASGNRVVKDAAIRDRLAEDGVLCIEMEAAGVLNTVDCLVIRGICDYCDVQKNDDWQEYAAAAAAAYAKLLLRFVASEDARPSRKRRRLR